MLKADEIFRDIGLEVAPVLKGIEQGELEAAVEAICAAKRIFVAGMGRSGYMMRCFAMRLMQMGFNAYMVGDTSTPSASSGDLLAIGSGSGETESLKGYAAKAKKLGCRVLAITGHPESSLGRSADLTVILPVQEPAHKGADGSMLVYDTGNSGQKMLLGSRLELCLLLLTEALSMMAFHQMGFSEAEMMRRHACFE